jgi:hypothetical protein
MYICKYREKTTFYWKQGDQIICEIITQNVAQSIFGYLFSVEKSNSNIWATSVSSLKKSQTIASKEKICPRGENQPNLVTLIGSIYNFGTRGMLTQVKPIKKLYTIIWRWKMVECIAYIFVSTAMTRWPEIRYLC